MKSARIATERGTLAVTGEDGGELVEALREHVVRAERESTVLAERVELAARAVWLKGDHLPGSASMRHSLRRILGIDAPREREQTNLRWLRTRMFRAPAPLAAGVLLRAGRIRYQFLCMAELGPHRALDAALREASAAQRNAWIGELARETARMHALHFVHRNLHLRNVLATREPRPAVGDPRALTFVDVWRGGHPLPRRAEDYDLACLMLEGARALDTAEQRELIAIYCSERAHQGSPVDPSRLLAAADRRRGELLDRISREPGRWRAIEPPLETWNWRAIVR